ncbi:hypothetical protein [Flavobacterium branchiicola]|uniref:GLPGLI family protein n=1 Tax=Flavobacterium branchiicola TaxID=1114875 RepID=A0ABV9PFD6_9FLAO|nr:hypothetical protein [Flavobacterium branchiicola]MBS7254343.1 hypothetical protein [Flavobacterium branchiicola]
MISKITVVIFILLGFKGHAQTNPEITIDDLVSNYIQELQSRKIDTICIYENYCIGCELTYNSSKIYDEETCTDELHQEPAYIFWKEKSKTYFSKINYCYEYSKIILENDTFWQIYFSNKTIIENELVKPFEYITTEKSKKAKYTLAVSNSSFQNLKFITNGNITEKQFDNFDLQKEERNFVNINYKNNINLKSKLIVDILEKTTSGAEKNNTLKKIKSR